ncbi:MAG TPA: hypothetical protein VIG24_18375 [Acidimicrobiia bacterium]
MADEWVTIEHPDVKGTATVPRSNYESTWKAKGWRLSRKKKESEGTS